MIMNTSIMSYYDVALVEPGDPGASYPDQAMWDFVTVEGSTDGTNWDILIDPYDSRFADSWAQAFNTNSDPDQSMFQQHTINLNDFYSAGDSVSIRFRLFADEYVTGWGWAIDDVEILSSTSTQPEAVTPKEFALLPNYPNPFNATTTLRFTLKAPGDVSLLVYDIRGRKVATLIDNQAMNADRIHEIRWSGIDDAGRGVASGLYYVRLKSETGERVRRITLLK